MSGLLAHIDSIPFAELSYLDEVSVACSAEVRYAVSGSKERWVAKRCGGADVVAEACGWLLARELGLPVVTDARVTFVGDEPWWLGAVVENAGHFTPSAAQQILNPEALGGIVLLDALLGNEDRHDGNLLVAYARDGARVVAIDFAGSWAGSPTPFRERGLQAPSVARIAPGITRGLVETSASAAALQAENVSGATLSAVAYEACRVARYGRAEDLDEALVFRFAQARVILTEVLAGLP